MIFQFSLRVKFNFWFIPMAQCYTQHTYTHIYCTQIFVDRKFVFGSVQCVAAELYIKHKYIWTRWCCNFPGRLQFANKGKYIAEKVCPW